MTALANSPNLWWLILLLCTVGFFLGVVVGSFAHRMSVREEIVARDEAIAQACYVISAVCGKEQGKIDGSLWHAFAVEGSRFLVMARDIAARFGG